MDVVMNFQFNFIGLIVNFWMANRPDVIFVVGSHGTFASVQYKYMKYHFPFE